MERRYNFNLITFGFVVIRGVSSCTTDSCVVLYILETVGNSWELSKVLLTPVFVLDGELFILWSLSLIGACSSYPKSYKGYKTLLNTKYVHTFYKKCNILQCSFPIGHNLREKHSAVDYYHQHRNQRIQLERVFGTEIYK